MKRRVARTAIALPLAARRRIVALLTFCLTVLTPAWAQAHGTLKSSVPTAGAHLGVAPTGLRLTFTESPELTFTTITLRSSAGSAVLLGPVQIAPDSRRAIVVAVQGALAAGTYTVEWKTAGADGHPVTGRFDFTIAPGAQGLGVASAAPASGGGAPTLAPMAHEDPTALPSRDAGFDAESPLYVAVRWLLYGGMLTVIGTVAFQFVVLGFLRRMQRPGSPVGSIVGNRTAAVGLAGAALVGGAVVLRLYAQSFAMHGAARVFDRPLVSAMLTTTTWGRGWLLQVVSVIAALAGFWFARRGGRAAWGLAAIGAVGLAFTPALSGHAASAPTLTTLAILADALHVLGAGGWLGSLLVVLLVGIPAALRLEQGTRGPGVSDLVNAFSPTALAFAGLTASTGVFAAWLHVGAVSALWQTTYGRTLLLKLAILSIVAATGAYNWRRIKPVLGDEKSTVRLRRSATIEVAVAVLVLVVTAVLVATPTGMAQMADRAIGQ